MRNALVLLLALVLPAASPAQSLAGRRLAAANAHARDVTITRDDWGIPHIHGRTDADAVFGLIYAQAEDDFNRVETNYLNSLGWLAQAEGESAVYSDLRQRLFIDTLDLKRQYKESPEWMQRLMTAWADGLNFFLLKHKEVTPRVIRHFEPWMALSFSEGSIGGDIERVNLRQLERFYGKPAVLPQATSAVYEPPKEPSGSNGIAIAPQNTMNHKALLLINPHTSFFFRAEVQMSSNAGLNAYGAVTWGQFFVYQGFNDRAGWMHTSSGVDAVDEYMETVSKRGDRFYYRYGNVLRPMSVKTISIPFHTDTGLATRTFTVYRTHHGPVTRDSAGKWVSIQLMQEPVKALMQSYIRTKARSYSEFLNTMQLKANSSNNTIFADALGNIAYFHGNFIPRRDTRFDFTKPVDGSNPATDWKGLLRVDEAPNLLNPRSGYVFNVNNWPWSAAGPYSLKREDYPAYVERYGESFRGLHALRVLQDRHDFTLESLMKAAYDSYVPAFAEYVPKVVADFDALASSDPMRVRLADQVATLRGFDYRWSAESVPTSLSVFWLEALDRALRKPGESSFSLETDPARRATPSDRLAALVTASDKLTADFGKWNMPWGEINRFQRITGDIVQPFNDAAPSIPVPFVSSRWGSLASFGARQYPQTKKWYGTSGNSFVAVVEFGKDSVRARAVTAGGESGHPSSKHFNDEAGRYASGDLREVYYYPSQLKGHTERVYHPGE